MSRRPDISSENPEHFAALQDEPESELDPLVKRSSGGKPATLLPYHKHLNEHYSAAQRVSHRRPNEDSARIPEQILSEERQRLVLDTGPESEVVPEQCEEEGNWIQFLTRDCPSVVSSDDVRCDERKDRVRGRSHDDISSDAKDFHYDAQNPDVDITDNVKHGFRNAVSHDARNPQKLSECSDVKRRRSAGMPGDVRLSQSDVVSGNGVIKAGTGANSPGAVVRSFTADCLGTLEEERPGKEDHGATEPGHKEVRRLSSGDFPHWLQTAGDKSSDVRNMTLIVPGPSNANDSYLIGRASPRGDMSHMRMTRLTEVAPTNSSIVDDEDQWKMPLDLFTSKKQGTGIAHYTSKRIRSYYKAQDSLITAYEDISLKVNDDLLDTEVIKKQRKLATFFSKVTLAVNVLLLVGKLVASILSGSISIISSLVDSVVDLLSGIIMWWATRAVKTRDPYTYPQGRTKLEPVAIIILSVVMALASLQLVRESVEKVVTLAADPSTLPRMEAPTFAIAGSTVVIKLVLWLVCRRVRSSIVQALAMDHRNDVLSNSVAIVCGYLGSREFQNEFGVQGFMYVDPAGAILISLYIVINWWQTGSEQIKMLTGHTARPDFLSKLTWTAMNHDRSIRHIDTVRAFHFGNNFLVELDIVLPEDMSLRVAHDIGESLQQKLENIPEVERAFVHLDYEYSHNPNSEHKVV